MSKFASDATKRIEFDDGEFVEIKSSVTYGDVKAMNNPDSTPEERDIQSFLFFIKSWNFKEDGKEVPVTEENIKRLDFQVYRRIDTEIANVIAGKSSKKKTE